MCPGEIVFPQPFRVVRLDRRASVDDAECAYPVYVFPDARSRVIIDCSRLYRRG
jgi:hypothetical protein